VGNDGARSLAGEIHAVSDENHGKSETTRGTRAAGQRRPGAGPCRDIFLCELHGRAQAVSRAQRLVICCIADDVLFGLVSGTVAEEGLVAVRCTEDEVPTIAPEANAVAMISELGAQGAEITLGIVHRWRKLRLRRPVLLYYRPDVEAAGVVGQLAQLAGVLAWARDPNPTEERHQLACLVREILSRTPAILVRALINAIRPMAGVAVSSFVDALVDRLERNGDGAPLVTEVAARADVKVWVVRRACRRAKLPLPERLIEWLTLIYVITMADWESVSVARAAATIGVSDKYIRRLRASLLPGIPQLRGALSGGLLATAVRMFAEACGLPHEQATAAAERLTA